MTERVQDIQADPSALIGQLAISLPLGDWQFWVVSLIALFAACWLLRGVLPIPFLTARAEAKKKQKRVSITIEGKAPSK